METRNKHNCSSRYLLAIWWALDTKAFQPTALSCNHVLCFDSCKKCAPDTTYEFSGKCCLITFNVFFKPLLYISYLMLSLSDLVNLVNILFSSVLLYPRTSVEQDFLQCSLISLQLLYEEVLSHSSPLETIATKGSNMAEHCTTQQEVQQLQCRYNNLKDKAKVPTV